MNPGERDNTEFSRLMRARIMVRRLSQPSPRRLISTTPNGHTVIDVELLMQEPDVIETLKLLRAFWPNREPVDQ
jgi:hypothetical protein